MKRSKLSAMRRARRWVLQELTGDGGSRASDTFEVEPMIQDRPQFL
jgi:hypothetical protein